MNNSFSVKVERFLQRISKQEKKNQTMEIFLLSVVFTFSPAIKQIIQFLCGFSIFMLFANRNECSWSMGDMLWQAIASLNIQLR